MSRSSASGAGRPLAIAARARSALAAERLDAPLEPAEAAWLDEHLAGCADAAPSPPPTRRIAWRCARCATDQPEPPRDLWARTAAAIEREAARRGGREPARAALARWPRPALGVLSGVAVDRRGHRARRLLSGGFARARIDGDRPGREPAAVADRLDRRRRRGATPFAVGAGDGRLGRHVGEWRAGLQRRQVNEVCPVERPAGLRRRCRTTTRRHVDISIRPKSISKSPVNGQAVVVGEDANGERRRRTSIALPTAERDRRSRTPKPTPAATPRPTPRPSRPPSRRADPERRAVAPRRAAGDRPPTPDADAEATPTPDRRADARADAASPPESRRRSRPRRSRRRPRDRRAASRSSASRPPIRPTARGSPSPLVRPKGDTGPDIYVWRVGDDLARQLTDDHASVFASWVGNRVAGQPAAPRRPAATPSTATRSSSIRRAARRPPSRAGGWRPVVDPATDWAVVWDGRSRSIRRRHAAARVGRASSSASSRGRRHRSPTARPPSVVDGAVAEFDVRWDETGDWLAVWVADATRSVDRPAEPRPPRPGDRPARPAPRRAAGRAGAARVLDRRRPPRLGDPARPGWRGQPRPDRGLDATMASGRVESGPGRRTSSSSADLASRRTMARAADARSVVWSPSRATQQVGRRVGAHRRPRPGRASGSRRFSGSQPVEPVPAARSSNSRSQRTHRDRRLRSGRSTTPSCRPASSTPRRDVHRARAMRPDAARTSTAARRQDQPGARRRRSSKPPKYTLTGGATFYDNGTTAMRLPRGTVVDDLRRRRLHRARRQRLRTAEDEPRRRPVPAGLLRDLRLPVLVRARPR